MRKRQAEQMAKDPITEEVMAQALINREFKYNDNVTIKIPTVKEVALNKKYNSYLNIMFKETKELFFFSDNAIELIPKYPDMWSLYHDGATNATLGAVFGDKTKTLSQILFEAISYWTGLPVGESDDLEAEGFHQLSNGTFVHVGSDWVIDKDEFEKLKTCISFASGFIPQESRLPEITSKSQHEQLKVHYQRRMLRMQKEQITFADKVSLMQTITGVYISIDDITQMSILEFEQLYKQALLKEAYDVEIGAFMSMKFDSSKQGQPKHWIQNYRLKD